MSLKVLHILWSLGVGGIERLVLDLAIYQQQNGLKPQILVGQAVGHMLQHFEAAKIPILDAKLKSGYQPPTLQKEALKKAMRETDIIHMHAYNPFFAFLAKKSAKPIIFTDHGNNALGRKKKPSEHILFPIRDRFLEKHVQYLSFNSVHTRQKAVERISLEKVAHSVVYNGINLQMPESPTETISILALDVEKKFIIGTTSRFALIKRIDRLILAFAKLDDKSDAHLLLVGEGPLRAEYEALIQTLNIEKFVTFTGFQTPIHPYQDVMDVCVFPSCAEPFGLVAVETYALGKPTLVMADGGGILEIIESVEPEDVAENVKALTDRINYYQNLWRKGKLGKGARVKARTERAAQFGVENMGRSFTGIYRSMLRL